MLRYAIVFVLAACGSSSSSRSRDASGGEVASGPEPLVCVDRECTDPATGLVWAASDEFTPSGAAWCEALATANHDDYRLPTLDEALALPRVDGQAWCTLPCDPATTSCFCTNTVPLGDTQWVLGAPLEMVWCDAGQLGGLWLVTENSTSHSESPPEEYPVVCVRP